MNKNQKENNMMIIDMRPDKLNKGNDIKELLYDILKEKSVEKAAELIQIHVDKKVSEELLEEIKQGRFDLGMQKSREFQNDINNANGYIQELEGQTKKFKIEIERALEEIGDAHGYIQELEGDLERAESDYVKLAENEIIYVVSSKNLEHYSAAFGDSKDAVKYADGHFRTQSEHDISFDNDWLKTSTLSKAGVLLEKHYYTRKDDKLIGSIRRIKLEW